MWQGKGGNSFVAVLPVIGPKRVLVVRHVRTGKWMMPGGQVDPGESPEQAAARELREESGYNIGDTFLELIDSTNGTSFFRAYFSFSPNRQHRVNVFHRRKLGETDDYGFAFYDQRSDRFVVANYDGQPKDHSIFRGGTIQQLKEVWRRAP